MRPELRPRRRRLREYSMWTFVAPIALLVSVVIVVSVVSGALRREHTSTNAPTTGVVATTAPIVSKGPDKKSYYRVREGDTLATIADKLGTDIDTLYRLNPNVDEFNLQPGQRLRVQ